MALNRQQKATLTDVAAKVGVSPRTVSRVVNDEGGFSVATREKVMSAIAELGYRPNLVARSLITNRSNTLAFVAPVIDDPFFPEVAQGVQDAARDQGLTMFLAVSEGQSELQDEVLDRLMSHAVDGAIVFPVIGSRERLAYFAGEGLPIVMVDDELDHKNVASVRFDLPRGVELAVDHLRHHGRTRLAMLAMTANRPPGRRETAFRRLHDGKEAVIIGADATYDGGYQAMKELLVEHRDVDGVFAYNDMMAIGAIAALHEVGKRVPDDVAIVGCDDIEMSSRVTPALTTIRLDRERLGFEAVTRLVELRDTGVAPDPLTLPVELVVRQSS